MEVFGISLVAAPINQTLLPETHFGFKQVLAGYDWASRRVCVTVQRCTNEIPNRQKATLELVPLAPPSPLLLPSTQQPPNSLNLSFGFIKTWTRGRIEKWAQLNSVSDGQGLGAVLQRSAGKWPMKHSLSKHNTALVAHVWR